MPNLPDSTTDDSSSLLSYRVLVVEDSRFFRSAIVKRLEEESLYEIDAVESFADLQDIVSQNPDTYRVAIVDLNLPDCPVGASVELVQKNNIPAIVFTGGVDDGVRQDLWEKRVVDYVLKSDRHSLEYVTQLVKRITTNSSIEVLVVDDSKTLRLIIVNLLKAHQFSVHEACDGLEALEVLNEYPNIKLIVSDYNMPNMDGVELTAAVREKYDRDTMAIIALSTSGNAGLSAKFLKSGANDFISKPFEAEEFYCRINQNIELLEHMSVIRDLSNTDFLTGLYNRRYFIESGRRYHAGASRSAQSLVVAMIDIDHFKNVNDTYGHEAGDKVIQHVSTTLKRGFRESDLVCRFGGEEFCVLLNSVDDQEDPAVLFERVRSQVAALSILCDEHSIEVTISIGVCARWLDSLEEMINASDTQLYESKESGRNKVSLLKP